MTATERAASAVLAERWRLVGDLMAIGAEVPATAWLGSALRPHLATEPLSALRDRLDMLRIHRAHPALALHYAFATRAAQHLGRV